MATNELAIRFTETKYATRNEVSKELKMSLIDNIWSNILSYRSTFNHYLTIRSVDKNRLILCQCPSIAALSNGCDKKLLHLMKEHMGLNNTNGDLKYFEDQCAILSLKALAKENDLDISEVYLRSLIQGDARGISEENRILLNYYVALQYVKKAYMNPIDMDFMAELYSKITGIEELTSFYRSEEDKNRENRVIIDRVYTCAPVKLIDEMMTELFKFIATSTVDSVSKAAITYYYIVYVRPFDNYSDEIALLMAKAILAHNDLGEIGVLLPLETLFSQDQEEISKYFEEVRKTSDTTYFVNYMLKFVQKKCDELLDIIVNIKTNAIRKDFYRPEIDEVPLTAPVETINDRQPEPVYVAPQGREIRQNSLENQPTRRYEQGDLFKEQPTDSLTNKPLERNNEQVLSQERSNIEQPVKQPTPTIETTIKTAEVIKQEQIAVNYVPPALDEKQASRLEQHLLELDPSLRKHEAKFYARHCTLGKKYTISQYKKSIGCVYETARTSMDHLVELGYYKKEMVKNKFVYSPIPRKD